MRDIRFKILFIVFFFGFAALLARLFYWQVIKGDELSSDARAQYQRGNIISAPRGNILASDQTPLTVKETAWTAYAVPPELKESISKVADTLAPFFADTPKDDPNYRQAVIDEANRLKGLLGKSGAAWVPLKSKLDTSVVKNIQALGILGIGFDEEEKRSYPEGSVAAQLLGFVGKNKDGGNVGYFGLEGYYDLVLSGKAGFTQREKDAKGIPILLGQKSEVSAINGVDLVTNIDKRVQLTLESKLLGGIEKYGASGGTAIIMNPADGAIFGMASYPSYDPAKYWDYGNEFFKNPAVSDTFEPGSVFKIIVMASGLDAGVVKPDTICDICAGPFKVDKYFIETWDRKYHPDSTMTDVIVHSDNVGMAYVSQKLGADSLYDYLDKFGIGEATGIDLQGEVAPKLRERGTWNSVDLATASFGQGIALTPIEMLRAAGVIANHGIIVTPQVVRKLAADAWEEDIKPQTGGRVISEEAAREMTGMMVQAAEHGESQWTDIKGFKIAGKTGTAQIPIAGHYDSKETIATFVGFAPADKPKFVMIVTLKSPQSSQWASETAAPLWYSIARDLFPYLGIQPEN